MTSPTPPRETPLAAEHAALGAVFTDFGGWRMPVRYTSDLAEHRAVREAAGLFDVSHMAEFLVTGAGAGAFLDRALAGRLSAMTVGRAKYTMLLDESGGVLDDLIAYRLADDRFLIVANAAHRDVVGAALAERASGPAARPRAGEDGSFAVVVGQPEAEVEDVSDAYALLALQGPASVRILASVAGLTEASQPPAELRGYAWTDALYDGAPAIVARTGYTGEDGFELLVPADRAVALWRELLAAGEPHGLAPAGLAARDTLRLEAGMPLCGHELTRDTTPAQAGLGRIIPSDKTGFVGEAALAARPEARVLVGLASEGRRAGRAGYPVRRGDRVVGEVTSGALSPTLGHPIAMAYVDPDVRDADDLAIEVRGTLVPAAPTALPFYHRSQR
ncbi:glycine cleavage system aminomethyltransferase GcvT [Microbacterium sp. gxy059]|uniref:glycine cleavage system aminomethyltransferase GcvT n=1 Tax=Microbacterium sp. gxy059 TaxID=2957199 RepID=UPI003D97BB02